MPPPKRPVAVLVIAVLHFAFGGFFLMCGLCGAGFQLIGQNTALVNPGQQAPAMTDDMDRFIAEKLPYARAVQWAMLAKNLGTALLMIVAGVGLLQMRRWGWILSIVYALLSFLVQPAEVLYNYNVQMPLLVEFIGRQPVKTPQEARMISLIQYTATITVFLPLLFLVYPTVVLIVMLHPKVRAAFRPRPPLRHAPAHAPGPAVGPAPHPPPAGLP